MQVVRCTWKPDGLLKFRHVAKGSVEAETSTVVAALQGFLGARLEHQAHAPMRAHVGEAAGGLVLHQNNGLAVDGFKVFKRQHGIGLEFSVMGGKLPAIEHGLEPFKHGRVGVVLGWKRSCRSNVGIDHRFRHGLRPSANPYRSTIGLCRRS